MFDTRWAESESADTHATQPLEVVVVHTTESGTQHALHHAQNLATGLHTTLRLLATEIVPYPLPLSAPPIHIPFMEGRLRSLVRDADIGACVDLRFGRDRWQTLMRALPGSPVVVVGGRNRRLWPTAEQRLARRLCKCGYHAVFVPAP
jgi:hypothetical protein